MTNCELYGCKIHHSQWQNDTHVTLFLINLNNLSYNMFTLYVPISLGRTGSDFAAFCGQPDSV